MAKFFGSVGGGGCGSALVMGTQLQLLLLVLVVVGSPLKVFGSRTTSGHGVVVATASGEGEIVRNCGRFEMILHGLMDGWKKMCHDSFRSIWDQWASPQRSLLQQEDTEVTQVPVPEPLSEEDLKLRRAAREGNLDDAREARLGGADLDNQFSGTTPLHEAVRNNKNSSVAKYLIGEGANVNAEDLAGSTPLMYASGNCRFPDVVTLLIDSGADVNHRSHIENAALHWASRNNKVECVNILINRGANVDLRGHVGRTPILSAAGSCALAAAQALLDAGADVNEVDHTVLIGRTVLMWFVITCNSPLAVDPLLDSGASINLQDNRGWTALHYARRNVNMTNLLINKGASLDIQDDLGETALMLVATFCLTPLVAQALVDAGAALNLQNFKGWTALHLASSGGHLDCVHILINNGASLDIQSEDGYTALMRAANSCHLTVAQALVDAGASKRLKNKDNQEAKDIIRCETTFFITEERVPELEAELEHLLS